MVWSAVLDGCICLDWILLVEGMDLERRSVVVKGMCFL